MNNDRRLMLAAAATSLISSCSSTSEINCSDAERQRDMLFERAFLQIGEEYTLDKIKTNSVPNISIDWPECCSIKERHVNFIEGTLVPEARLARYELHAEWIEYRDGQGFERWADWSVNMCGKVLDSVEDGRFR